MPFFKRSAREQERFLQLSDEIESLVGTDRWKKCSPKCMLLVGTGYPVTRGHDESTILLTSIKTKQNFRLGSDPASATQFGLNTMPEAGVDVNLPDNQRLTPLMAAARNGDVETVRTLLAHGAVGDAKDKKGRTALDQTATPEVRELLVSVSAAADNAIPQN